VTVSQLTDPIFAVYALSLLSMIGLFVLINASVKRLRRHQIVRVAAEEEGAAYTISYVMVIPCYALLICILIETAALFPAKIGTVYSAYAAARTAAVWSSATDWQNAEAKSIAAGKRAFVPFASATQGFARDSISGESALYVLAQESFAEVPVKEQYLLSKFQYAQRAVTVNVSQPGSWDDEITAMVSYEFPFNVPGVSRIFGKKRDDGSWYFPIQSSVRLANQAPQNTFDNNQSMTTSLGIGYGTLE
jgi:Flp pilus assembly protein TadG